jgi:hypothetical protein
VDYDEQYGEDHGYDEYRIELTRQEVEDSVDEQAPGLDPAVRAPLVASLVETIEEGEHVEEVVTDGDEGPDGIAFELTQAGQALVRREALRATHWRDPAPKEPPRVRPRTASRPLRAARRTRRHTTRPRAGPGSDDSDPDPEPSHDRAVAL